MPSPKSGKAGTPVAPAEPGCAFEADDADPGKVAEVKSQQTQSQSGKYGKSDAPKPFKPTHEPVEKHWIEIKLVGEDDEPIPGEAYEITLPDGSVASGTLDNEGYARIDNIPVSGNCEIAFPKLDRDAWEKA